MIAYGNQALSGIHRYAAWVQTGTEPEVVQISKANYEQAMRDIGQNPAEKCREVDALIKQLRRNGVDIKDAE